MNLAGKRVLVTGGAGFIGSHLTEKLLEIGAYVTVLDCFDRFYKGKEANLTVASTSPKFSLVDADIRDRDELDAAMRGIDVVIHEAGQAGVGFSIENPTVTNDVNVDGTLNVLWSAKNNRIQRVINASSSSIFGEPQYVPIDEAHPTLPTSPYGVSKLAAEQYARAFHRVYGMDVVSLRYFSVYGPRGRPDQVIHRITRCLIEGKSPVIHGDGNNTRDFTHVQDVVSATILAAEAEGVGGESFNIGFGSRTSINDLADKLAVLTGMQGKLGPRHDAESKGDFPHTQADNRKAARMLHWRPNVGLDVGLKDYVGWLTMQMRLAEAA